MKTIASLMCPGKAGKGKRRVSSKTAKKLAKPRKAGKAGSPRKARPTRSKSPVKLEPPVDWIEIADEIKRRTKSECFSEDGSLCDVPVSAKVIKHIKARVRAAAKKAALGSPKKRGRSSKTKVKDAPMSPSKAKKSKNLKKAKRITRDMVAFQKNFVRSGWAKRLVWKGKKMKTSGGLEKKELMKSKCGKIVSKRRNQIGSRMYKTNHLDLWITSLMRTRSEQGSKGFVKVKKAGTRAERALWEDTCKGWMDMVALRVVKMMQGSPQLMGKVNQRLLTPAGKSTRAGSSSSQAEVKKDE